MIKTLHDYGYHGATTASITSFSKQIRNEIVNDDPITYSDLRQRSILREMSRLSPTTSPSPSRHIVMNVFDAWLDERNAAANRHLYPDAVDTLRSLRQAFPDLCVGAVTNGRGDPRCMPLLEPFFDFCVSGEDSDVFPARKPARGIYRAALAAHANFVGEDG
eukprot:CAMPEP_0172505402 /NCGR_PEP_ID=MMETSP1066-20121228/186177_1 /TAXON_ID=671091 /ORGANISM="Coscinodiscus wailesii, Strain CCMP2513" /LENGTH=161 /DNA_ID=CAMNT_0013281999 /DNA_START=303 /DNA_END=785 /DNA_ORIENTATION=+